MKSIVGDLAVTHDEIADTPDSILINPSDRVTYQLIDLALLSIAGLLLFVTIVVKYYVKHGLTISYLLSCQYIMWEHVGIDISKGIDVNKTSDSNEWRVCCYWHFSKTNFTYETLVCNGCNFWFMTKSEAVNRMKNVDLSEKKYGQL